MGRFTIGGILFVLALGVVASLLVTDVLKYDEDGNLLDEKGRPIPLQQQQTTPGPGNSEIDGVWQIDSAVAPNGTPYGGTVTIATHGLYSEVTWNSSGGTMTGLGYYRDGRLVVAWGAQAPFGFVRYKISMDGSLLGDWSGTASALGNEEATGGTLDAPSTTYEVAGTNPDGTSYTGRLDLRKSGDVYDIVWSIGDDTHRGIGIRVEDRFLVAWTPADNAIGVTEFTFRDGVGLGPSAMMGSQKRGIERIVRPQQPSTGTSRF